MTNHQTRTFVIMVIVLTALAFALTIVGVNHAEELNGVTVFYVEPGGSGSCLSSWANACDLQDALDLAQPEPGENFEIWVSTGEYVPSRRLNEANPRTATFVLTNTVALYGGFVMTETHRAERNWLTKPVTLTGDLNNDDQPDFGNRADNAYHVLMGNFTDATALLDGFIVTGGQADASLSGSGGWDDNYGGGLFAYAGNFTLNNVIFTSNFAAEAGGGIYINSSAPSLSLVTFEDNFGKNGGGMYNNTSDPTYENVAFIGNTALSGGGLFNWNGGNPELTKVVFDGNAAAWREGLAGTLPNPEGGGFHNNSGNPSLVDVTFTNNQAHSWCIGFICQDAFGGAMFSLSGDASIDNASFSNNSARSACGTSFNIYACSNPKGGALMIASGTAQLTDVDFTGNYTEGSCITFICSFEWGGGFYNDGLATMNRITFTDNSSEFGGGLRNSTDSKLFNVHFHGNSATGCGGGMDNSEGDPALMNVVFTANKMLTTAMGGGGVCNSGPGSNPEFTNVTFAYNIAPSVYGGAFYNLEGNPTLTNVIMWGNRAGTSTYNELYDNSGDAGEVDVTYSIFEFSCPGGVNCGTGMKYSDPYFVQNPSDGGDGWGNGGNDDYGDLRLRNNSPAVDAGDWTALPYDLYDHDHDKVTDERYPHDINGSWRTAGDNVDMGATERPLSVNLPIMLNMVYGSRWESEPNDVYSQANGFLKPNYTYYGSADEAIVSDYFKFYWSGTGTLHISVQNYLADQWVGVYFDQESNPPDLVVGNYRGTTSFEMYISQSEANGPGIYYLRFYAPAGHPAPTGPYSFHYSID